MSIGKYSKIFVTLFFVISSFAVADSMKCIDDANYYQNNFVYAKDPESFNLEWAICEEKLGHKDEAMSAYERVIIYNPNNLKAINALAKIYSKSHMQYEAEELKKSLDYSQLTPQERQIVSTLLDGYKESISTRYSVALNFGYDDNLNYGINKSADKKEINSIFHSFAFSSNYVNELNDIGGLSFQGNINLYWQDNYSAHYYDILYGAIDFGIGYSIDNILIYLPIVYKKIYYLNQDLYSQYGIAPRLTQKLTKSILLNLDMQYIKQDYVDIKYQNAENNLLSSSISIYKFYAQNYIYGKLEYLSHNAISNTPTIFTEYKYFKFLTGVSYKIDNFAMVGINYQYGHANFDDFINITSNKKRSDNLNQINFLIEKRLNNNLKIIGNYIYSNNQSNDSSSSYQKQIITFGLQYNY